jgi:hypothetical protein
MLKYLLHVSLAAFLLTAAAWAAPKDVGGVWIAKYQDKRGRSHEMVFNLAVAKGALTGSADILNVPQLPISNGKLDGNKVHFEVRFEYDPDIGHDILVFDGSLVGDTLQLERTTKGKPGSQKLVCTRASGKK